MRLVRLAERCEQRNRLRFFASTYRSNDAVEEDLDEADAVSRPGPLGEAKRARVDEQRIVPLDIDVDEIECGLLGAQLVVVAYAHGPKANSAGTRRSGRLRFKSH